LALEQMDMRIAQVIVVVSLAALVAMTAPALARNSQAHKAADEQTSSASCQAYQQAPDGTWTALPCQEHGAATQTEHRPVASGSDEPQR
jgi:hypothetical protein